MRMWKQKAKNENTGEARLRRALISARRNLLPLARTFSKMDFEAYFMCRAVQALQSHIGCCKYGFIDRSLPMYRDTGNVHTSICRSLSICQLPNIH